jgi:hypothetical protein
MNNLIQIYHISISEHFEYNCNIFSVSDNIKTHSHIIYHSQIYWQLKFLCITLGEGGFFDICILVLCFQEYEKERYKS